MNNLSVISTKNKLDRLLIELKGIEEESSFLAETSTVERSEIEYSIRQLTKAVEDKLLYLSTVVSEEDIKAHTESVNNKRIEKLNSYLGDKDWSNKIDAVNIIRKGITTGVKDFKEKAKSLGCLLNELDDVELGLLLRNVSKEVMHFEGRTLKIKDFEKINSFSTFPKTDFSNLGPREMGDLSKPIREFNTKIALLFEQNSKLVKFVQENLDSNPDSLSEENLAILRKDLKSFQERMQMQVSELSSLLHFDQTVDTALEYFGRINSKVEDVAILLKDYANSFTHKYDSFKNR